MQLGAYKKEMAALLVAFIVIGSAFVIGRSNGAAESPCPGEKGETITCWNSFYHAYIAKYGSIAALQDLKTRYAGDASARNFCHPLLHEIGEAAGKEFGSVAKAYEHGDTFCRSGFYHGVLEGLFGDGGGDKLLSQLDSICSEVKGKDRYSYDYFSCVHGIGHGLMAYFGHDVFTSLDGCGKLSGDWEKASCYGGVFMENVISDTPEEPSKYLKKDDLVYPCNAVLDKYRYQCFQMQTSHILAVNGGDFANAFAICESAEAKYRIACFQSIGRDASGWSYGSKDAVLSFCGVATHIEERSACLEGASVDYIQTYGPAEARALCAMGEGGVREACSVLVEKQIRML